MAMTDLRTLVYRTYPEFGNSTFFVRFKLKNHTTEEPKTDEALRELLSQLVADNEMSVKVAVVTLSPSGHCRRFASFTVLQNIHVYLSSNAVP